MEVHAWYVHVFSLQPKMEVDHLLFGIRISWPFQGPGRPPGRPLEMFRPPIPSQPHPIPTLLA